MLQKMLASHLQTAVYPNNYWYDAHRPEVNRRWTNWISGIE
jgi:hypothetical protein